MKKRTTLKKRILGLSLAVLTCVTSIPAEVFATSMDNIAVTKTTVNYSDFAQVNSVQNDVEYGYVEVAKELDVSDDLTSLENATGEDLEWEENLYPLDLLIVDPDSLYKPDDMMEEESLEEAGLYDEDIADAADRFEESIEYDSEAIQSEYGDYTYNISDGKVYITKYAGTEKDVKIPDTIEETPVTYILSSAFDGNTYIETVSMPDTITDIGSSAFRNCTSLKKITLSTALTTINNCAFYNTGSLNEITIPASVKSIGSNAFYNSASKVIFADGTEEIPQYACYNNENLKSVVIPNSVNKIGSYAFYKCKLLDSVSFSEKLTDIGSNAFYYCSSIKSLDIPNSVKNISNDAFRYCISLSSVTLTSGLQTIGSYAFGNTVSLEEIYIPDTVTSIGNHAFYNSVKKISFAGNITEIPDRACYYASNLEEVIIPDTVISIGDYAFYYCTKLTNIDISAQVTNIGKYAFSHCISLETIQMPEKLLSIDSNCFYGCSNLSSVVLNSGLTSIGDSVFYNCSNLMAIKIPATVTSMGRSIFYNSVKSIVFADGMTDIPESACDGATRLEEAAIPSSVKKIGNKAFYGCKLLKKVVISEGVITIGDSAFYGDTSLRILIPDSITSFGKDAFSGCIVEKQCGDDAKWELDLEAKTVEISGSGEIGNGSQDVFGPFADDIEFIDIENGITKIGDNSFGGMDKLSSIVMGDNITEIGESAFDECGSLVRVELSKDLELIDEKAFNDCNSLETMIFVGSIPQIDETALPEQKITAYHPKSNGSYTEDTKNLYNTFNWKQWDDTLPPRDVVLVLDVSGSMSGTKIAKLKEAVNAVASQIGGRITNTRVAIVSYANTAKVVLPFSTDVVRMQSSASRLTAGGGTYYLEGFSAAENLFNESNSTIRSFILFSDGAPSDSRSRILEKAELFRNDNYYIYTVGLSPTENNRQLLIDIAGDEQYYFEATDIDSLVDKFIEMSNGIGRSGSCGDNVKWRYNDNDKQLIISIDKKSSGNGRMFDISADATPLWDAYAASVEKIIIDAGVTYIGINSLGSFSNVTSIQIDKTVTEIGSGAFANCKKLTTVYYPGTEDDWKKIRLGSNNQPLIDAKKVFNTKDPSQPAANPGEPTGVLVKPATASINVNETLQLSAEVYPKDAKNNLVTWSSSNPSVAKVSNTGKVTPVNKGTAVIKAETVSGGFTSESTVTVTDSIPSIAALTLGGGSNGIAVDKNVPIIGGKSFKIDLPASLPVSCVLEDNKIKIGINIKKENLYSSNSTEGVTTTTYKKKSLKEQFEEFKNDAYKSSLMAKDKDWLKNIQDKKFLKANMPGMEKAVTMNCVGYVEGAWSEGLDCLQGSVVVTIEGTATAQTQMVVWVIPVTVNCEFSASGAITATVGYNFKDSQWYGDLDLALSVGIEPYAGVGFGEWISGGVYGKASTDFNIVAISSRKATGLEKWTLSGEMGLKAYFAKKSASIAIVDKSYTIYDREKKSANTNSDAMDSVDWDDVVVENLATTYGVQESVTTEDGTIVTDVYNGAKPAFVTAGGVSMLVYVADDADRALLNQTKLVYSIFDEETGTYGAATSVIDDGTADFEPDVFTDGTDIYVAWLDSTRKYSEAENPEIEDYLKTFRTHVAKYNKTTKRFDDLGTPQQNAYYTYMPKLAVADGKLQLLWVENKDNTLLGYSEGNSICVGIYTGTEWSKTEIPGLNAITSMAVSNDDSELVIAYTTDQDNDMATREQDLYIKSGNNSAQKICDGNISSISYTNIPGQSDKVLVANIDGGLSYLKGNEFIEVLAEGTMNKDTKFVVDGNKVLYLHNDGENRNIAVSTYDNGEWGTSLLTHESGYIDYFSKLGNKLVYLKNVAESKGIEWSITSSIKELDSIEYSDIELETVDFAVGDAYAGATLPVTMYIKNNGTDRVTKVHTSVSYANTELVSGDVDVDILPGETQEYEYSFDVPADLTNGGDFVFEVSSEGDRVSGNNTQTLSLLKADLDVSASYDTSGETSYLNIAIENRGLVASTMVMTVKDENETVLFEETGTIAAGDYLTIRKEYSVDDSKTLTITVKGDAEEFYEMNNTTWLEVSENSMSEDAFKVGFANTVSDPYEGLTYNFDKNRYEVVFRGEAIKPDIQVRGLKGKLREGVDYTVKYSNNINVDKKGNAATVTVTGKGNYAGKKVLKYYIVPADLYTANEKGLLTLPTSIKIKSGTKVSPVIMYRDYTLKASDMTLSNKNAIKSNTTIYVSGKGNNFTSSSLGKGISVSVLSSTAYKNRTIKVSLKAANHVYNGSAQELTYSNSVTNGELTVTAGNSKTRLKNGTDYSVKYINNINAGRAKIIVTGIGSYVGTVTKTFTIKADKANEVRVGLANPGATISYDPLGAKPEITVEVIRNDVPVILKQGKDYMVSYSANKAVGTGKYTVSFIGNYKGHAAVKNQPFNIVKSSFEKAVIVAPDKIYSKPGKYFAIPYVTINNATISKKDYSVEYLDENGQAITGKISLENNEDSKTITVRVTGKRYYQNTVKETTYKVTRVKQDVVNISNAKIVAAEKNSKGKDVAVAKQEYTGGTVRPDIRVLVKEGKNWVELDKKNYQVIYINNVNKGKATILVQSKGSSVVGSKATTFSIGTKNFGFFSFLF